MQTHETWVRSLGQEDPLEEGMTTHSSVLAWRIPWTEEPDGLQSTGSHRVGHDLLTHTPSLAHTAFLLLEQLVNSRAQQRRPSNSQKQIHRYNKKKKIASREPLL